MGTGGGRWQARQDRWGGPPGVLASDLSVSEYVLLGGAGCEPLALPPGATLMPVTSPGR